ncbi:sensor histidine kinase YesM [Pedobacter cryoconitis]|uniref:Sensor histidine kinase YesM n=1 Tax=Pedobacter cryoconitis TaxID=188932 RepID=A0A7W8YVN4_9SPHI|nr:histidine kinase [Pedobacter cryoconitis]MBB5622483.1 sensor histidine kinase YesM [Pedobacter cryoconitis]MBB5647637.1 sensor histidine kinase YesM [Pedobacter cryoconitis]
MIKPSYLTPRLNRYNTWVSNINWSKTYSSKARIAIHIVMWLCLSMLYLGTYNRFDKNLSWLLATKDLTSVMIIFYSLSYYVLPKLLFKGKIISTLLFAAVAYIIYGSLTYLATYIINNFYVPSERLQTYAQRILDHGFAGVLSWWGVKFYILDFLYTIAPPVALKLMKSIVDQSNKRIVLERDNLNLEINFLKAQINPHFLFNTLNNIYRMVNKQDPNTADMVLHLSDLMRYTLYESNVDKIPLDREAQFIKDYLELERIRYGEEVSITTDMAEDFGKIKIVPLILFPFIENAFKHGADATVENSWIEISVKLLGNDLHFEVNNSVSPHIGSKSNFGGVGMVNVKKRLTIHYADKYNLSIKQENGAYKVKLQLTLN